MTGRARPERVVEGEQPWLRCLVGDGAGPALEALAGVGVDGERGTTAFTVARLDGISQAAPQVAFDAQSIDDDLEGRARFERRANDIVEPNGLSVDQQTRVAAPPQALECLGD